jgi:Tol biopolymer transport system component
VRGGAPRRAAFLAATALSVLALATISWAAATTIRASVDGSGGDADGDSHRPVISADGRFVAFESDATDLVAGDTNGRRDIFVRNVLSGTTIRASVSATGGGSNGHSQQASISADGRYVAFLAGASNLVAGDTNGLADVFVRDVEAGTTERVGVNGGNPENEQLAPSISGDGRYVAFTSFASDLVPGDTNGLPDVFIRDRLTGSLVLASIDITGGDADGASASPFMSGDGRFVVFLSEASDLVPDDTDGIANLFLRDLVDGTTTRVDVNYIDGGNPNRQAGTRPAISGDGRYVVFMSYASNLVPDDNNGYHDVFLRDMLAGTTVRVSVNASGGDPNRWSQSTAISGDGRYVAFRSKATNLVPNDGNRRNDVFVRDMTLGRTVRVSVNATGGDANWDSFNPAVSSAGDLVQVGFVTKASNIVVNDMNGLQDIFIRQYT